jgi:hypothetical protein
MGASGIMGALGALVRGAPEPITRGTMKKSRQPAEQPEPLGIIISNGDRTEYPTVFSAYIWGPAPEPTLDPASKAA